MTPKTLVEECREWLVETGCNAARARAADEPYDEAVDLAQFIESVRPGRTEGSIEICPRQGCRRSVTEVPNGCDVQFVWGGCPLRQT